MGTAEKDDRHLTQRKIKRAKPEESRYRLWDDDPTGLHVDVLPSGTKTFRFHYKHDGRSRWYTIGSWG
ncbi:MAG: Arm DNA-binding domain-containing protein, partial [Thermoanaerobaculia bacterium]|nr:Arm DNA-binding domain-containing protein [Thermoanaerobaculia bacterium]